MLLNSSLLPFKYIYNLIIMSRNKYWKPYHKIYLIKTSVANFRCNLICENRIQKICSCENTSAKTPCVSRYSFSKILFTCFCLCSSVLENNSFRFSVLLFVKWFVCGIIKYVVGMRSEVGYYFSIAFHFRMVWNGNFVQFVIN